MKYRFSPATRRAALAVGLFLAGTTSVIAAATEGWYTTTQATRGHQLFNNYCAQCHRPDLKGAAGPALIGPEFLSKWGNKPVTDVYTFAHDKMPATNPGSVPSDQMWTIMAYILQKNGFAAGDQPLDNGSSSRSLKKG
jgi:mono/diheme cytochrome c family protein